MAVTEDHTVYDAIYMKCPGQVKPLGPSTDWWSPGHGAAEQGEKTDC